MDEKNYAFKILSPFGFEAVEIDESKLTDEYTNVVPDYSLKKPTFNSETKIWEEYDMTSELQKLTMQQASQITSLQKLAMSHASDIAELKQ